MGRPKLPRVPCAIKGCKEISYTRDLCFKHYRKWHYVAHERARRGAKETLPMPVGTRVQQPDGYVRVKMTVKGRIWEDEHRLVMQKKIKRKLLPSETVHHKNGIRWDNNIKNLELWSQVHPKGQRVIDLIKFAKQILKTYVQS